MTIDLQATEVYRAGVTASVLNGETRAVTLEPNTKQRVLDFRFKLDSKGGGKTSVLLRISLEDFPALEAAINQIQALELSRLRTKIAALEKEKVKT